MKKFKPQHSRLLFIDKKIRDRTYPNCASLGEEWEVSAKTIQRDLDYMRSMLDAPLAYDAKMRGYYYTEESFHLPAIALNDSDLFAVFIAEKVLKQYENTPIYARLQSVFAKIEESLPDKISVHSSLLEGKFSSFGIAQTRISSSVWDVIFSALRSVTSVEIIHQKPETDILSRRIIDPYHVMNFQGEWYVIAYCHSRDAIRTFALSRIKEAKSTNTLFTIPADFNFKETTRTLFGVQWSDKQYLVQILFSERAAPYIKEREYHPTQTIAQHEDKSITMTFTTSHLLEVKRWVLTWGEMARVLAPQELIDDIKHDLQAALDNYGEQNGQ